MIDVCLPWVSGNAGVLHGWPLVVVVVIVIVIILITYSEIRDLILVCWNNSNQAVLQPQISSMFLRILVVTRHLLL